MDLRLVVRIAHQEADLVQGRRVLRTYRISSAQNGLGCSPGSQQTPTGILRIAAKIGDGCPTGTVFRNREPTDEIWSAGLNASDDLVLTRILWLDGCEAHNASTLGRCIYLHGTNHEDLLGTPVSNGCIRFSNEGIEELFDLLAVGTPVEVVE
jgi:lipoprotein-anchoring transpeptidase ErfK/SrfK